jgi:hypothetical protein
VTLYPSQLTGRRVHWLLTVEVGGVLLRMADDEIDVTTDAGEVYHYSAGLDGVETTEGIDLFGDSVGQLSVPLEFLPPPGVSIAELVARGVDLSAGRGELARWVEGTTYEARRVVLVGGLSDPEYGDDGEAVSTSIEERLAYDETLTSAAALATNALTWPGNAVASLSDEWLDVPYPIIIGRPGYQGGGGYITGSPALWVDHRFIVPSSPPPSTWGGVVVLAGHHVSAERVYLNNDQYTTVDHRFKVFNLWDAQGHPVAVVPWYVSSTSTGPALDFDGAATYADHYVADPDVPAGGLTLSLGAGARLDPTFVSSDQLPLFVIWDDEAAGGGGLVVDGVTIRGAGDVLAYFLGLTTLSVDWGRFAAAAPLLEAYQLDGCVTERVSVWSLIQDELLQLLPVSLVSGPRGLYPVVWRYTATASDAVLTIDADADPGISRDGRVAYDSQDRVNRFSLEYQLSYRTGNYAASLTYGSEADAALDSGVTAHPLCTWAQARGRAVREKTASSAWVYDDSTAHAILEWWAAAYALPTRTVSYRVPEVEFAHVERGMVATLTDASIYCSGAVCLVRDVLTDGSGSLTLTLVLLDNPLTKAG